MVEQGTQEWLDEKLGVISGTRAAAVMGTKIARRTLLAELVRELMTSDRKSFKANAAMKHGLAIEPEAASYYGMIHGVTVTDQSAYIESDIHPMFAASPDGLIDEDGGYEGKRLDEENHLKILLGADPDKKYIAQCNWNMFITGRQWWDLHFYCETLPESMKSHVIRIDRDEGMMEALYEAATSLLEELIAFLNQHGLGGLLA